MNDALERLNVAGKNAISSITDGGTLRSRIVIRSKMLMRTLENTAVIQRPTGTKYKNRNSSMIPPTIAKRVKGRVDIFI